MPKQKPKKIIKDKSFLYQLAKTISIFLLAFIFIRFYVFQPFTIEGASMEPSFYNNEYLIVDELSYNFSKPKRGDVVIFKHPEPACNNFISRSYFHRKFFNGPCVNYIKRVIGLPGETVVIKDGKIKIINDDSPNGFILKEDYTSDNIPTLGTLTVNIGKNEYFVLGDNRNANASSDSREWGPVPKSHIVGKAFVVLFPIDKFELVETPKY